MQRANVNLFIMKGVDVNPSKQLSVTKRIVTALVLCGAACMGFTFILGASGASAEQAHLYSGTFGGATSTVVNPYPLMSPDAVAADGSTHDLYVADNFAHRVEKFSPAGVFLSMIGKKVNETAVEEGRPETEQNVCPAPSHPADVCREGEAGSTAGTFEDPRFVAVDNSSDASKGDLYVGDAGRDIDEVQAIDVNATGGTYTLSFESSTSVPIAYNAPLTVGEGSSSVQVALEGLFKAHLVTLRGSAGHYEAIFDEGELKGRAVPQFVANSSGLSGGAATATVTTLVHGSDTARVEKLDPSGRPVTSWAQGGQLNGSPVVSPPAPISGPFNTLTGIAVDTLGNLWVPDENHVFEFDQEAKFLTGWKGGAGELTVDSEGDLYFYSSFVLKSDPTGHVIGEVVPSRLEYEQREIFSVDGLAFDTGTGELYIDGTNAASKGGVVRRYDSSCDPVITPESPEPGCTAVESFGAGLLGETPGKATIDSASSTDPLYVVRGREVATFPLETVPDVLTTAPTSTTLTSTTLTGTINPSGIELNSGLAGCRFEWGETTTYEHTAACDKTATQIGGGNAPVEVQAPITGLRSGKVYYYRLVASNANDVNSSIDQPSFAQDLAFGPPVIEKASVLEVTATETILQAQLDPRDLATRVRVEYGPKAGVYARTTPEINVNATGTEQIVTFELTGLEPGVTYHYRVVAENVLGEGTESVIGLDQTFVTQPVGGFSLPDGRGWDLVSPPNKHGARIETIGETGLEQASVDGETVSYFADAPTEAVPQGNASGQVQVLSTRSGSGWSSVDIATAHQSAVGTPAGPGGEYKFFSRDLSSAIVEPLGGFNPSISTDASEKSPYLRTDFAPGDPAALCTSSCFHPLVTGEPGFANVPAGTEFGEESSECNGGGTFCGPTFLGASPDASHVVLSAGASLVEGAPHSSLYEWSAGRLQLVSIRPGLSGPAPAGGNLGSGEDTRNAISADGSRVVWSEKGGHLYLRDLGSEETLQLDRNKGGSGKGAAAPVFQDASNDDSTILFTDTQQLTSGSGASTENPELYRCQVITGEESGELECDLTDLTPANGSESADVQGVIPGASEDGSFVYFFANGVLAHNQVDNGAGKEEAKPGHCETGEEEGPNINLDTTNTCNLYMAHGGAVTFIALLPSTASRDWAGLTVQPTRVAPDGEWLEFMSQRPLTEYDSRDVTTGRPVAEIYLYSAAANRVVCASCDPSGARPHGVEYETLRYGAGGYNKSVWLAQGIVAADVPPYAPIDKSTAGYQDRYLSDSGRLFFNSTDALVPQDSNGALDVYEYEPPGVGDCSPASATFSVVSDGCVDLVSSGTSGLESAFIDASENGNDVFFMTAAQLSYHDTDSSYDIYDARVGGGEIEPVKPVECLGDACQGFVEAPNDPTPDSLTFQGPGNLLTTAVSRVSAHSTPKGTTKCAKGRKLVKGKCVKGKTKPKKKVKGANRNRGAKR